MDKLGIDKIELLGRHQGGDWSEMYIEDKQSNEESLKLGNRIFSRLYD